MIMENLRWALQRYGKGLATDIYRHKHLFICYYEDNSNKQYLSYQHIRKFKDFEPLSTFSVDDILYQYNLYSDKSLVSMLFFYFNNEKEKKRFMENKNAAEAKKSVDPINPAHYKAGDTYETIRVIEAWGLDRDFHLGNVIKYVSRAGKKDCILQDLRKAQWYLNRRIEFLEKQK